MSSRKAVLITIFALSVTLVVAGIAAANVPDKAAFDQKYPAAKSLSQCQLCHTRAPSLNPYGQDYKAAGRNAAALAAIENKDSDKDGATNVAEINAGTWPGNAASKPVQPKPAAPAPSKPQTAPAPSKPQAAPAPSKPQQKALFRDIVGHWAKDDIEAVAKSGLLSGYPGGTFRPNNKITRAEFAAAVLRLTKLPETTPYLATFSDVKPSDWYYGAVESAYRAGFASGVKGKFNPNVPITREEVAQMIVKATGLSKSLSDADISKVLGKFSDAAAISSDKKNDVAVAVTSGLMTGYRDKTFKPKAGLTRAEAAAILLRASSKSSGALAALNNYYVGPSTCATCHQDKYKDWLTTGHSKHVQEADKPGAQSVANFAANDKFKYSDVKFIIGSPNRQYFVGKDLKYLPLGWNAEAQKWEPRAVSDWLTGCATCHTTGYNQNDKTFVALNITCESCHGPGAKHVAGGGDKTQIRATTSVQACESCHGGERQVGQITQTKHFQALTNVIDLPYYRDGCLECHSATVISAKANGKPVPTVADFRTGALKNDRNGVTCVACHDPHKRTEEYQLRKPPEETCVTCHNGELGEAKTFEAGKEVHHPNKEMWEGRGGIGVPEMPAKKVITCTTCHMTNGNHYFKVGTPKLTLISKGKEYEVDSCASCHSSMTAERIEEVQSSIEAKLTDVKALLDEAKAAGKDQELLYKEAFTNYSFVESDGSRGVHNPDYAAELLNVAKQKLNELLGK